MQLDASGAEGSADGLGVGAQACTDPGQGAALLVEADGLVDLPVIQSLAAYGHTVAVQVVGDGGAVDPEPGGQVFHGGPGPVAAHQLGDGGQWEGYDGCPLTTDGTGLIAKVCTDTCCTRLVQNVRLE